ncbi:G2/mitotic-specific cyclin [Actinomortierella wolfii]|nr:G2/mitotic-specific cyclin [Actinomortierella wolfii]
MSNQTQTRPLSTHQSSKRVLSDENACPLPVQYIKDITSALSKPSGNTGKKAVLSERSNGNAGQGQRQTTSQSIRENHNSNGARLASSRHQGAAGPSRAPLVERPLSHHNLNAQEPLTRHNEDGQKVRIKEEDENRVLVKYKDGQPVTSRVVQLKKAQLDVKPEDLKKVKKEGKSEVRLLDLNKHRKNLESKPVKPTITRRLPSLENVPRAWLDPLGAYEEEARRYEQEMEARRPNFDGEAEWEDLELCEMNDPMMAAEYSSDIFEYFLELQAATMPNPKYMETQPELAWKMRAVLLDWIAEVHYKFRMLPETLFLAVNIMDRFLSLREVSLVKYQLVGITSLFIAAKYEEVVAPSIQNYVYMSDGGYTAQEIRQAERYVLQTLEFSIAFPNPMNFLRRVSKADNYNLHSRTIAKYLMELPLLDHHLMEYAPAQIAAAALCLARRMMGSYDWDATMVHYSGYYAEDLERCMERMIIYLERIKPDAFIFKKYAHKVYMKASVFVRDWVNGLPLA